MKFLFFSHFLPETFFLESYNPEKTCYLSGAYLFFITPIFFELASYILFMKTFISMAFSAWQKQNYVTFCFSLVDKRKSFCLVTQTY